MPFAPSSLATPTPTSTAHVPGTPLPVCPDTVSLENLSLRLPSLPDGQGMTLDDWIRVTREHEELATGSIDRDEDLPFSLASFLCRSAEQGEAFRLARVLPSATPPTGWIGSALTQALLDAMGMTSHLHLHLAERTWKADLAEQKMMSQELIVAMLLAAGTPVTAETLGQASSCLNPRLLLRLLRAWPTINPPSFGYWSTHIDEPTSPLHRLITDNLWSGRHLMLDALLAAGHPVDATPAGHLRTPLIAAVLQGDVPQMHRLIAAGAALDHPDKSGMTPLHWAVSMDHDEEMVVLLDAGADPTRRTHDQRSLLHVAAARAAGRTLQVLLDRNLTLGPADEDNALKVLQTPGSDPKNPPPPNKRSACIALLEQRSLRLSLARALDGTVVPDGPRRRL